MKQVQACSMQFLNDQSKKWVWSYNGDSRVGVANTAVDDGTNETLHLLRGSILSRMTYWSWATKPTTHLHVTWLGMSILAKATFTCFADRLFKNKVRPWFLRISSSSQIASLSVQAAILCSLFFLILISYKIACNRFFILQQTGIAIVSQTQLNHMAIPWITSQIISLSHSRFASVEAIKVHLRALIVCGSVCNVKDAFKGINCI